MIKTGQQGKVNESGDSSNSPARDYSTWLALSIVILIVTTGTVVIFLNNRICVTGADCKKYGAEQVTEIPSEIPVTGTTTPYDPSDPPTSTASPVLPSSTKRSNDDGNSSDTTSSDGSDDNDNQDKNHHGEGNPAERCEKSLPPKAKGQPNAHSSCDQEVK